MLKHYKYSDIDKLADILKQNGIIIVPTDTVYGLCGITTKKVHDKLYLVKKRPKNKLFPVMCANKEQIKKIAYINEIENKIIDSFMPGAITIILKKKKDFLPYIKSDTIAVRLAPNKLIEELILKINKPLFMTSANISGSNPCDAVFDMESCFPSIDGIVEGKQTKKIPSTIIDCSDKIPKLLREGPITIEEIKNKL